MKLYGFLMNVSGIAVAAAGLSAQPAMAQDKTNTEETAAIVVTGLRSSVQSATATKRNADQIVDSISAQDIGALPDRSVAETLQRISGVSLTRTASELTTGRPTDPGRIAPEGGGVTIRGLTGVASTSNGRDIFSAGSRALDWAEVSSDLISGIDVYKNPSAEMIEGALSGIIDLKSRKPFDQPGQLISLSGDVSYGDFLKEKFWSGNALYSNRWTTPGGAEIGILVGGSINNKGTRTNTLQSGIYQEQALASAVGSLAAGTKVYVPSGLGLSDIDWRQRREMVDGVLQFRPNPDMTFTLEAVYSKATPHELEYASFTDAPAVNADSVFNGDKAMTGGRTPGTNMYLDTRHGDYLYRTYDYSLNWKFNPGGGPWTFSADVQRISSTADVLSFTVFDNFAIDDQFSNANRPTLNWSIGSDPQFVATPTAGFPFDNKGSYEWAAAMDHIEHNRASEWATRADVEYAFNDNFLKSLRVGARYADRDYYVNQTTYNWSLLSHEFWGGGTPVYLNQDVSPGLSQQTIYHTFPNFMHGDQPTPLSGWFPAPSLVQNTKTAYQYLEATKTAGWGWSPLTFENYPQNQSDQREVSKAGYAVLRFGEEGGALGRFEGNIGVRVIRTEYTATGWASVGGIQTTLAGCKTAYASNPSKCNVLENALKFLGQDPTKPVQGGLLGPFHNNYTDVLPSLNLNFHLTHDLQLRVGIAKAMLRPEFRQTSPTAGYSFNLDQFGGEQTGIYPYTGNLGNPYLKPMTSWQWDLSLEYYWGHGNALTFGAFYKDIANQIVGQSLDIPLTNNGVTLPFQAFSFANSSKHAKITGFEVGYTQFLDFLTGPLSGLGFQGNFTLLHATGGLNSPYSASAGPANLVTSSGLPYEQLSKYAYNATLLYAKYGVDARLAYNWRSKYLMTVISANNFAPTWAEDYGQLDGSAFVNINSHVKVGVQVTNILGTKTYLQRSLLAGTTVIPKQVRYQVTDKDRVVDVALRVRF
ncbi:MAG: TonB-dependent receptor [Sphingobium sp.]|nr:TonB-dependent receptor [Sphingobium sp.]